MSPHCCYQLRSDCHHLVETLRILFGCFLWRKNVAVDSVVGVGVAAAAVVVSFYQEIMDRKRGNLDLFVVVVGS